MLGTPRYILLFLVSFTAALAATTGSGSVTYHDYQALPLELLKYNPPFCGMPYTSLDVTRITAVAGMTTDQCGTCLKVTNSANPSKFVYVLAVDKCMNALDISKPAFAQILDIDAGHGDVSWTPVDKSLCAGVYPAGGI
ncbi:hypothetical protein IW140_004338 [Coemansia sp. RSA 1813]|nr:hypothetical protein LPJ74_004082 [Coemansia sp. RSA 1843]KAJ2087991.1 hypothetical protein IW138_004588 [Coemansia sp. RSA 986]KAJ2211314.1 hypothetical protein EV179_005581 [Coemansia sp. RSA 487]KAJ2567828.1 hypothetical protein IW140_004338 [Coemansia sp. RSA 1813]